MSMNLPWTVIGIFEDQDNAKHALADLREAGFSNDQIGFVFRDGVPMVSRSEFEAEEKAGGFTSGIVGGMLGAADALLTPVLGPSTANTIPTAAMPIAEQTIQRLQSDNSHNEQPTPVAVADPLDDESTQDTVKLRRINLTQNALGEPTPTANTDIDTLPINTVGEKSSETQETVETSAQTQEGRHVREEEATGAFTGGVVGGVLGAAVALLIPVLGPAFAGGILVTVFSAALGAMAGGFLGAFAAIGVPEEQARHYEEEFKSGRTIVTVKTEDRQQDALDILHRNGVHYANTHSLDARNTCP